MDFLNKLLSSFVSFFYKKNQSVLGIDIGSSAIKIIQIRKKRGKVVLETYGELALGPYAGIEIGRSVSLPNGKIDEALRDILREAKTNTLIGGVALPLSSSFITFITIPPVQEKQLIEAISLEARKYIPVSMNEVTVDYSIVPREENIANENLHDQKQDQKDSNSSTNNKTVEPHKDNTRQSTDVLVVAIHNEYIDNYQTIIEGTGIQTSFYELELFSSIRAVVDHGIHSVMIFDMGARLTKLYVIEKGLLRLSHIINKGGQDITLAISKSLSIDVDEAENMKRAYGLKGGPEYKELTEIITVNLDYIFYEANATLLSYQKKYMKNVSKVILSGGGVLLKGFTDLAKISFQTEIALADPFSRLETPAFLSEQFAQSGPEFAVAIGCALRRLSEME